MTQEFNKQQGCRAAATSSMGAEQQPSNIKQSRGADRRACEQHLAEAAATNRARACKKIENSGGKRHTQ